jgi:hypothetical protein
LREVPLFTFWGTAWESSAGTRHITHADEIPGRMVRREHGFFMSRVSAKELRRF